MYHFSLRLLQVATNSYITKKVPVLDEQTLKVTRYKYKLTKMKVPEANGSISPSHQYFVGAKTLSTLGFV